MGVTITEQYAGDLSRAVAEEIRAILGRKAISQRGLARKLGVGTMWVTRRIGAGSQRTTPITLDELVQICAVLGVPWQRIIIDAARTLPRLDSNQQPFDYLPGAPKKGRIPTVGNDNPVIPIAC